jgi:hypothetical protein
MKLYKIEHYPNITNLNENLYKKSEKSKNLEHQLNVLEKNFDPFILE